MQPRNPPLPPPGPWTGPSPSAGYLLGAGSCQSAGVASLPATPSLPPGCHPIPSISCKVRSSCPFSPPLAAGRCVRCPRGLAAGLPFPGWNGKLGTYFGLMGRDSQELFCRQMPWGGSTHRHSLDHLTHARALWLPRSEWNIKYQALNALIVNVRPPQLYRHGSRWSLKAL